MTFPALIRYGIAAGLASAAGALLLRHKPAANRDAAPARTARHARRLGGYRITGATVSIRATPEQILTLWQTSAPLWSAMEFLPFPEGSQPGLLLPPDDLRAMASRPLMIRIVTQRQDELVAWRSDEVGHADMHGRIRLHGNGDKGTGVEVIMAVRPRDFRSGLQTDSVLAQTFEKGLLRDLRRMKMLIEAGEIAIASPRNKAA